MPNCVQCGKKLTQSLVLSANFYLAFCEHPDCPNYGLLQAPGLEKKKVKPQTGLAQVETNKDFVGKIDSKTGKHSVVQGKSLPLRKEFLVEPLKTIVKDLEKKYKIEFEVRDVN